MNRTHRLDLSNKHSLPFWFWMEDFAVEGVFMLVVLGSHVEKLPKHHLSKDGKQTFMTDGCSSDEVVPQSRL